MNSSEPTDFELVAYNAAPVSTAAPVTVAVGHTGQRIYFDADPSDGTIAISADYGMNLEFDVSDFVLIAELLSRTAVSA